MFLYYITHNIYGEVSFIKMNMLKNTLFEKV